MNTKSIKANLVTPVPTKTLPPATAKMREYAVWSRHHTARDWTRTSRTLQARTDKEAASRLRRMFRNAGFSSMSLCAIDAALASIPKEPT